MRVLLPLLLLLLLLLLPLLVLLLLQLLLLPLPLQLLLQLLIPPPLQALLLHLHELSVVQHLGRILLHHATLLLWLRMVRRRQLRPLRRLLCCAIAPAPVSLRAALLVGRWGQASSRERHGHREGAQ